MEWSNSKNCKTILGILAILCSIFDFLSKSNAFFIYITSIAYITMFVVIGYYRNKAKTIKVYFKRTLRNFLTMFLPAYFMEFTFQLMRLEWTTERDFLQLFNRTIVSLKECIVVNVSLEERSSGIFGVFVCLFFAIAIYDCVEYIFNRPEKKQNLFLAAIEMLIFGYLFVEGLYLTANHVIMLFNPGFILAAAGFIYYGKLLGKIIALMNNKIRAFGIILLCPILYLIWSLMMQQGLSMNLSTQQYIKAMPGIICTVAGVTSLFMTASIVVVITPIKNILKFVGNHYSLIIMSTASNVALFTNMYPGLDFVQIMMALTFALACASLVNAIEMKLSNNECVLTEQQEKRSKYCIIARYILFTVLMSYFFMSTTQYILMNWYILFTCTMVEGMCCGVSLIIFGLDPSTQKQSVKKLLLYFAIFACDMLFMAAAGYKDIEWYAFAVFSMSICMSNLSFYKMVMISFVIAVFGTTLTVLSSLSGILPNENILEKHLLGFFSPNVLSTILLMTMCMYFYLRAYGRHSKKVVLIILDIIVYILGFALLWKETKGRSSEVVSIILLISIIIWEIYLVIIKMNIRIKNPEIYHKLLKPFCYSFVFMFVFAYLTAKLYSVNSPDTIMNAIERITSTASLIDRLRLSNLAVVNLKFTLFGQYFLEGGSSLINVVDDSYIRMLYRWGILLSTIYVGGMSFAMYRFWKSHQYVAITIMICIAILAYMESFVCDLGLCVFSIGVFSLLPTSNCLEENR